MQIGPFNLENNLLLAPMAGVTDLPFRRTCRKWGAGLTTSEMVSSKPQLRHHKRTQLKAYHEGEASPRSVQIVGADPQQMADAARYNADQGAQIIDINMGCPAKKVCNQAAGSALLRDEPLVSNILQSVVKAVDVPVTLKIRTGWDDHNRNAVAIAKIAESSGIQALAIHGRTRACRFNGNIEYDTIKLAKQNVGIPIIANGDIDSPQKAKWVLEYTNADAIMIGRGAQGQPWIFQAISHYLKHQRQQPNLDMSQIRNVVLDHLIALYEFYGGHLGVRIARKHLRWYFQNLPNKFPNLLCALLKIDCPDQQLSVVRSIFDQHGGAN